jgi:hypothetical protein
MRFSSTSAATDTAAEWVSAKPVLAAATRMPASPNQSCAAAATSRTTARIAAKVSAVRTLKALPGGSWSSAVWRNAHRVKIPP